MGDLRAGRGVLVGRRGGQDGGVDAGEAVALAGDELDHGVHERRGGSEAIGIVADVDDEHLVRAVQGRGLAFAEVGQHAQDHAGLAGSGRSDDLQEARRRVVGQRAHHLGLGAVVAAGAGELVAGDVEVDEVGLPGDGGEDALAGDGLQHQLLLTGS
jgi:hypothetical protein